MINNVAVINVAMENKSSIVIPLVMDSNGSKPLTRTLRLPEATGFSTESADSYPKKAVGSFGKTKPELCIFHTKESRTSGAIPIPPSPHLKLGRVTAFRLAFLPTR